MEHRDPSDDVKSIFCPCTKKVDVLPTWFRWWSLKSWTDKAKEGEEVNPIIVFSLYTYSCFSRAFGRNISYNYMNFMKIISINMTSCLIKNLFVVTLITKIHISQYLLIKKYYKPYSFSWRWRKGSWNISSGAWTAKNYASQEGKRSWNKEKWKLQLVLNFRIVILNKLFN